MNDVLDKTPLRALRDTIRGLIVDLPIGETKQWDELEKACGIPRDDLYAAARAARRALSKEGRKYRVVRGVGITRINDNGFVEVELERGRQGLQRRAKQLQRGARSVDINAITEVNKVRVFGTVMLAGVVTKASEAKNVQALGSGADPAKLLAEAFEAQRAALTR